VTGLDERLGNMEKALRHLTEIVEDRKEAAAPSGESHLGLRGRKRAADLTDEGGAYSFPDTNVHDRVVLQRTDDSPSGVNCAPVRSCSFLTLYDEFSNTINEVQRREGFDLSPVGGDTTVKAVLSELLECISSNDPMEITPDGNSIVLPPKQLLSMACVPFFQSQDLSTDLFCKKRFRENVERVYSKSPLAPEDTAWAVCFDLIIILGLGVDQYDGSSAAFLRPYLLNVIRAYAATSIFLRPGLINVQALALLVSHTNRTLLGKVVLNRKPHTESGSPTAFPSPVTRVGL
jgi:hypothetical protein